MGEALLMNRSQEWNPEYTYTGDCTFTDEGNGNWNIKFTSSGTLTFIQPNSARRGIDVFLVGGGGGGAETVEMVGFSTYGARAGGGGGYTATYKGMSIVRRTVYQIVVGAGGTKAGPGGGNATATDGGPSSAFGKTVNGGKGGYAKAGNPWNSKGGNGGSGGAAHGQQYPSQWTQLGGVDGGDGQGYVSGPAIGGTGQHTTTTEFAENVGTPYAQGGGKGTSTIANTGNGGNYNANGSSGVVIIRNARGV